MYDIIIIGSGPAGLSAAIYAQRACLDTIVIEKNGISGGQVLNTWEVDNYPGFPGVTGFELSRQFREHANKLGARVVQDEVVQVELSGNVKKVVCEEETYEARCVILASGAHHRTLEVPGEEELRGAGVSYCATCDGNFYRNRPIGVICTVPAQWHEVEFLAGLASQVTAYVTFDVEGPVPGNVTVRKDRPKSVAKDVQELVLQADDAQRMDGLFILRESDPVTRLLPELAMEGNTIKVNKRLETNIPGVYAAGDCIGQPLQISKATGDGLVAVFGAADYFRKKG